MVYLGDDNVVVNKGSLSKIMKIMKIIGFVLVWVRSYKNIDVWSLIVFC